MNDIHNTQSEGAEDTKLDVRIILTPVKKEKNYVECEVKLKISGQPQNAVTQKRSCEVVSELIKSTPTVTRFDLLKSIDISQAAELIIELGKKFENPEELQAHLSVEITKEELQQINAAAYRDGIQPLSFSFKQ